MQKWIILIVISIIIILSIIIFLNISVETEYVPEEEMSDLEMRKTKINLYYKDIETGELKNESRTIDSKELLREPYKKIVEMLMENPENEKLQKIIPDDANLLDIKLEKNVLKVIFDENILKDGILEEDIINSIKKTLTQFNEINDVIISI